MYNFVFPGFLIYDLTKLISLHVLVQVVELLMREYLYTEAVSNTVVILHTTCSIQAAYVSIFL